MSEWDKIGKNLLILAWCGWILIATPFMLFNAESVLDAILGLVVALYAIAIPASWIDV